MDLFSGTNSCRRSLSESDLSTRYERENERKLRSSKRRRRSDITDYRSRRRALQENMARLEERRRALQNKDSDLAHRQNRLHLLLLDVMSENEAITKLTVCASSSNSFQSASSKNRKDRLICCENGRSLCQESLNGKTMPPTLLRYTDESHSHLRTNFIERPTKTNLTPSVFLSDSTVHISTQTSTSDLSSLSSLYESRYSKPKMRKRLRSFVLRKIRCVTKN